MKTKTIGEILREEREAYGLELAELAKKTRIKIEYLTALEKNQFHLLPAATFVKGYIKSYAQLLGFDHQPLIALLRRDFKESAKGKLVPQEFIKPVLKKQAFWTPISLVVTLVVGVFATLLLYVGFQWYNLTKPPMLVVENPEENVAVSSQVEINGQTDSDAILSVNSQPVALQPDGSFETEIFLTREGMNTITVEAVDRRGKKSVVQRTVEVRF